MLKETAKTEQPQKERKLLNKGNQDKEMSILELQY
jgi:hypothetical protein